jgi:hypothetical protein
VTGFTALTLFHGFPNGLAFVFRKLAVPVGVEFFKHSLQLFLILLLKLP